MSRLILRPDKCSRPAVIGADGNRARSAPSSDPPLSLRAVKQIKWLLDESYSPLRGSKGSDWGTHTHTHTRRNLEEVLQRLGMCLSRICLMDDWITLWQPRCCGTRGSCVQREDFARFIEQSSSRKESPVLKSQIKHTSWRWHLEVSKKKKKGAVWEMSEFSELGARSSRSRRRFPVVRCWCHLISFGQICDDKSRKWRLKYISFVERKNLCAWK